MRKLILLLVVLSFLLSPNSFGQELAGIPETVKGPLDLENWLITEFRYRIEVPDRWQSPQETIQKRYGDCEDFAVLTSRVLEEKFDLHNDLIIVTFKNMSVAHLICIWKNIDGTYSFMSNNKLHETKKEYLDEAIRKFYPDCSGYSFANKMKTAYRYFYKNS